MSAVIAVRDGERYLREAIASVITQWPAPREIIVVDDGSMDSSAAVATGFGPSVRLIRQRPSGVAVALNRGIAEAREELVAMLDADDLWTPDKLKLQLDAFAADPSLEAVFGQAQEFLSPDLSTSEGARLSARTRPAPLRSRATMLVRRATLARVGPFDETWRLGEFVDWHARAEDVGMRSLMLERVVLHRRVHASNLSRSDRAARVDYARIARAALQRRRAAAG